MGVTPIEYRPWDGKRTDYWRRFLVISNNVFRQKLKSKWILALLIIGVILTHVFFIIFTTIIPHEGLTPEMMVGEEPVVQEEEPINMGGEFKFYGITNLQGYMMVQGSVYGVGTISGNGNPLTGVIISDDGFLFISGTVVLYGELNLLGGISGEGILQGNCTIYGSDITQFNTPLLANGTVGVYGLESERGHMDIDGSIEGEGIIIGDGTPVSNTTVANNGTVFVNGTMMLDGALNVTGSIVGSGSIDGSLMLTGLYVPEEEPEEDRGPPFVERQGGYLKAGLLVIFTILLASLVCSDLISEDLGDNSFILFFSRPIKSVDYLAGKVLGALWVLGLFCFLPLIIFCIAVMGTQSGSDYGTSLNVLGSTFVAGLLTTFIFVPYGILISSLTKRKSYATIGIFMSFFVLIIIGNIFASFDRNWVLLDPTRVLYYSYDVLYGFSIPDGINGTLLGVVLFCILVIPLVILYLRIHLKGAGK